MAGQDFTIVSEGGFGSQPIYPVREMGPGVVLGRHGDFGTPAHLVSEMGPGVTPVVFENGPVPGTAEHMMMMMGPLGPMGTPPYDPTPERLLLLLD